MPRIEVLDSVPQGGGVIEVGVCNGAFAEEILLKRPDVFYIGVDSWLPPFAESKQNAIDRLKPFPADHCMIINERSDVAAKSLKGGQFDLIYIDADHDYDSVMIDLEAWWPLVKPGGLFAGHDYAMEPAVHPWGVIEVKKAVDEWMAFKGLKFGVIQERCPTWYVTKPLEAI